MSADVISGPRNPYLSIVAVARNDNHGGDLLRRLQIFVDGIFANSARTKLRVELVLVEWNPPSENVSLYKAVQWPQNHEWCSVRVITVPRELHARFQHSAGLPLYQMIGKNVGIRRASGQFILATNIDIIFAPELFDFLATKTLSPGNIYRTDRYDIERTIPIDASFEEQIAFCETHIIRVSHKSGIINLESGDYQAIYSGESESNQTPDGLPMLHTNACGDFHLMSQADWFSVHGYAELDMYSFHIDSLLAFAAHYSGIKERYLKDPYRIYHIDHSNGFTPESMGALDGHLEKKKVPRLTDEELWHEARVMQAKNAPTLFNQESWGLPDFDLSEVGFAAAGVAAHSVQAKVEINPEPVLDGTPYLSVVITARNDDHGGNMLHRLQTFIDSTCVAAATFDLQIEIVIAEWNPPSDRPRLLSEIEIPESQGRCEVRVIEVPPEYHDRILYSEQLPLYQMLGKNVGIRRARGRFILSTNLDILLSLPLFQFVAKKSLRPGHFYRVKRFDISEKSVPSAKDYPALMQFCRRNAIRVHALENTHDLSKEEYTQLGALALEDDSAESFATCSIGAADPTLFTNACGDFTLMAKEDWLKVRGYPELARGDLHVDSLLLSTAQALGIRQVILPDEMHVFHIEHEGSWVLQSRHNTSLRQRISLDYHDHVIGWSRYAKSNPSKIPSNHECWGLHDAKLAETLALSGSSPDGLRLKHIAQGDKVSSPTEVIRKLSNRSLFKLQAEEATAKALKRLVSFYRPTHFIQIGTKAQASMEIVRETALRCGFSTSKILVANGDTDLENFDARDVTIINKGATDTSLTDLWTSCDRVLVLYCSPENFPGSDTRDFLSSFVDKLPLGSVVAWDTMWFVPQGADEQITLALLKSALEPVEGWQEGLSLDFAHYWKGGLFAGSRHVIPLLYWANCRRAELISFPSTTLTAFDVLPIDYKIEPPKETYFLNTGRFTLATPGNLLVTPLANLVKGKGASESDKECVLLLDSLSDVGFRLFNSQEYEKSFSLFDYAANSGAQRPLIQLGRALSLAFTGKVNQALQAVEMELSINPTCGIAHDLRSRLTEITKGAHQ